MKFKCGKCGGEIEADASDKGQLVTCPSCMEQVIASTLPPGFSKKRSPMKFCGTHICRDCGTECDPKSSMKGSPIIEMALWLCAILPGLLYTAWRSSSCSKVCRACSSPAIVPIDTPAGRELAARYR